MRKGRLTLLKTPKNILIGSNDDMFLVSYSKNNYLNNVVEIETNQYILHINNVRQYPKGKKNTQMVL